MSDPFNRPRPSRARRSSSRSPLTTPSDASGSASSREVAFVTVVAGAGAGSLTEETRRAVRVQAARASAQTRRDTIARRQLRAKQAGKSQLEQSLAGPSTLGRPRSKSPQSRGVEIDSTDVPGFRQIPFVPTVGLQLTPFSAYPTSRWHPQIQLLVSYYLEHFAPAPNAAIDLRGRDELRTQLWPEAVKDPALFNTLLLIAASHALVSRAIAVAPALLVQLSDTAIETINDAVAQAMAEVDIADSRLAAIALLAGWELEYGKPELYDTHMRGLETIIQMRGGFFAASSVGQQHQPLPEVTVNIMFSVGHDQAMYASQPAYLGMHGAYIPPLSSDLPSSLPEGFETLRQQHLVLPSLMHMVSRLRTMDHMDVSVQVRLEETRAMLAGWDSVGVLAASYAALQTRFEDVLKEQMHAIMRLAGLTLCGLYLAILGQDVHASMREWYEEALRLQPELLIGTVYADALFWALFTVCACTGQCRPGHLRILQASRQELGLDDWADLVSALSQFVYSAAMLDVRSFPLWEAVSRNPGAETISPPAVPTRLTRGIIHPTRQVAAALQLAVEDSQS